uniref:Uncharacterized protein n=1 Tax=Rhizophora mucronata TaxID=61149 RepID=A0A2P2P1L4_RHIMU
MGASFIGLPFSPYLSSPHWSLKTL